jgi:acyl-coenzyme A synthetase/AMP-(fatty) acid ligase
VIGRDFLRWRPTVFPGVPPIWRALASGEVDPGNFISLRLAISAGAPLDPGIARAFAARLGRPLRNFYGSSETGGIAFDRTGKATLEGGVGRALRGVSVTKAKGNRIRVCSAAVFTRSNRLRDGNVGCWIPPDEVEVGPRGELRLAGRRGKTVKIAGRRVNLAEVESRLRKIAGVHEAWVGVSLDGRGTLGAAVASERSADELRADLLGDTAPWKVPKKWLILPSLPQTARGKRDSRSLCAQLFGSRSVSPL